MILKSVIQGVSSAQTGTSALVCKDWSARQEVACWLLCRRQSVQPSRRFNRNSCDRNTCLWLQGPACWLQYRRQRAQHALHHPSVSHLLMWSEQVVTARGRLASQVSDLKPR